MLPLALPTALAPAQGYPSKYDFGTTPSEQEIAAVAIAIPPDGNGLPRGKGDYAAGKAVYETTCAACHDDDFKGRGRATRYALGSGAAPDRRPRQIGIDKPVITVESYWPYATTLFDYIRRAMPFSAPGSLGNDQVYAVTAYILAESNYYRQDDGHRRANAAKGADA